MGVPVKGLLADRPESRDAEEDIISVWAAIMCFAKSKEVCLAFVQRRA